MSILRIRRTRDHTPEVKFCECGCGSVAPKYPAVGKYRKELLGTYRRFVSGHNRKGTSVPFSNRYLITDEGCWLWLGAVGSHGYGVLSISKGVTVTAHRYSYEIHNGKIPEGLLVLHSCDNKLCVNPSHLSVGDHASNLMDAYDRGLRGGKFKRQTDDNT